MNRIYLDYAATTPVDREVLRSMEPYFTGKFGNPGSLHSFGQEAIAAVDAARETIAKAVGADFREIVFTGSATEANNLAISGAVTEFKMRTQKHARVIISTIEHESVLDTARSLAKWGDEVILIPVDQNGIVELGSLKKNLNDGTALVSIMYANNEIGIVQPIPEISNIITEARKTNPNLIFHTDAVQAFQFLDCNVNNLGVDLMTLSAHKIYGPKGIGALYVRGGVKLNPITLGGGQEFGLRSGTENVPSIAGFAKAVELAAAACEKESKRIAEIRDWFSEEIKKIYPQAESNGPEDATKKLPNILNIYFPGYNAQDLLTKFDLAGLAASSGSACKSRAIESSHVIKALGFSEERAKSSIRFSLGRSTTKEELQEALHVIKGVLAS